MVEIDGIEYEQMTPLENAYSMIDYINEYCNTNSIKNSKGEIVQINTNPGNPLYMILFGFAYLISVLQNLFISAANSLNVARSSDKQLENIAEIAHVERIKATKTTMNVFVSCPVGAADPCLVSSENSITYTSGGVTIVLHPSYTIEVQPGEGRTFPCIAESYDSVSIPDGAVLGFDTALENMETFHNYASVPAQPIETIAHWRRRIQARQDSSSRIDKAIDAIRALVGVVQCNIFYNYEYSHNVTVANITVPPRQAVCIVQGYSDSISETFYKYMSCLTCGSERDDAIEQPYITHSGQVIPFYIVPPEFVPIKIKVTMRKTISDTEWTTVVNDLQQMIGSLTIADEVTSVNISDRLHDNFLNFEVTGVEVDRVNNPRQDETGSRIFTRSYELLTLNAQHVTRGLAATNEN